MASSMSAGVGDSKVMMPRVLRRRALRDSSMTADWRGVGILRLSAMEGGLEPDGASVIKVYSDVRFMSVDARFMSVDVGFLSVDVKSSSTGLIEAVVDPTICGSRFPEDTLSELEVEAGRTLGLLARASELPALECLADFWIFGNFNSVPAPPDCSSC